MKHTPNEIQSALESNDWVFAKSMGDNPHWYTLRDKWNHSIPFSDIVEFVRECGTPRKWFRATFVYWKLGFHEYWSMGAAIDETTLINRAYVGKALSISLDGCFVSASSSTIETVLSQASILKKAYDSLKETKKTFRVVSLVDDYTQPTKHFFDHDSLSLLLSESGVGPVKSYGIDEISSLNPTTVLKIRDSDVKLKYAEVMTKPGKHPVGLSLATWYLLRLGIIDYGIQIRPSKKLISIICEGLRDHYEEALKIVASVAGPKTLKRIEEVSSL